MIRVVQTGDYSRVTKYLKNLKKAARMTVLDKYGKMGVSALSAATPVDTGKTSESWGYEIVDSSSGSEIIFTNSHINKGVPIAIILQYGHGTGTGGYVRGRDYINPAIQPVFDKIVSEAWREVSNA